MADKEVPRIGDRARGITLSEVEKSVLCNFITSFVGHPTKEFCSDTIGYMLWHGYWAQSGGKPEGLWCSFLGSEDLGLQMANRLQKLSLVASTASPRGNDAHHDTGPYYEITAAGKMAAYESIAERMNLSKMGAGDREMLFFVGDHDDACETHPLKNPDLRGRVPLALYLGAKVLDIPVFEAEQRLYSLERKGLVETQSDNSDVNLTPAGIRVVRKLKIGGAAEWQTTLKRTVDEAERWLLVQRRLG